MIPQDIIRKKRDGLILNFNEIDYFIKGIVSKSIANEQVSALTMAIFFQGLEERELFNTTKAMIQSGQELNWDHINSDKIVDKHSTGGVGDIISIPLMPILVALGYYVPMLAGRALGHTGGTIDKMSSIPNYNPFYDTQTIQNLVKEAGGIIAAQSKYIVPADQVMYSIRDITATVESMHLIASSIMSKKLAENLNTLVLDVKYGNGAFLKNYHDSVELATLMHTIANNYGLNATIVMSNMDYPICSSIGNSLEIAKTIEYLTNVNKDESFHEVLVALAYGIIKHYEDTSLAEVEAKITNVIESGKALEAFGKSLHATGVDSNFIDNYEKHLPKSKYCKDITLDSIGYINSIDTVTLGNQMILLGGGRTNVNDSIDYSVGFSEFLPLGSYIDSKTPICKLHYNNEEDFKLISENLNKIIELSEEKPEEHKLVKDIK